MWVPEGKGVLHMLTKLFVQAQSALTKDEGATMVEYGILVALIAVFLIIAITFMRDQLAALFNQVGNAL